MRKIVVTIIVLFFILSISFAVEYATTDGGNTIILNNDGTWEVYIPETMSENLEFPLDIAYIRLQGYRFPKVGIILRNFSVKSIKAFEFQLMFFDDFRRRVSTIFDKYSIQRVSIEPGRIYLDIWDGPSLGNPVTVHGFPTIVVFEDDSRWELSKEQIKEYEARIMKMYEGKK